MRLAGTILFLSAAMIMLTEQLLAQALPLSGQVVSRSVTYTPTATNNYSAVVYAVPLTGSFVLTQFCNNNGNGETLRDSTFGFIAQEVGCLTFSPGYALPKASQLICSGSWAYSTSISCSISGVLGP